jgi:hypothetical protein
VQREERERERERVGEIYSQSVVRDEKGKRDEKTKRKEEK